MTNDDYTSDDGGLNNDKIFVKSKSEEEKLNLSWKNTNMLTAVAKYVSLTLK